MISIRIGAALDSSVHTVFRQIPALARQARAEVDRELNKMGQSPYRDAPAHAKKDLDKVVDATKSAAQKSNAEFAKMADGAEKAANRAGAAWSNALRDIGRNSAENFKGIVRAGAGVVGGIARGAGVNLDVASAVRGNISSREKASQLSRMGFQEGQAGVAGQKQDPAAIFKDARAAADATAHSTEAVTDAMIGFVKKSGDLDLSRKMIADIGMLANSTGADFQKLAEDAGVLALKMSGTFGGDQVKQIEFVNTALRDLAAQGKLGAIDMAELAPQLQKIAATAGQFSGDPRKLIQEVGFIAQESAKGGGSGSAAQAATAVAAIPRDLKKPSNEKAFQRAGVELYADNNKTKFRDPIEIMKESVFKTKGSIPELGKMFKGSALNRSVEGLRQVYVNAGGGKKGEDAVNQEVKQLGEAALSSSTVLRDNAERLQETSAKAQLFQNRLEMIAGALVDRVAPSLERLAPVIESTAQSFGGIIAWAARNPGEAIVAAVAASIGKAALGDVIANAIKGQLSGAGAALTILSMTAAVATLITSEAGANRGEGRERAGAKVETVEAHLKAAEAEYQEKGELSPMTRKQLELDKGAVGGLVSNAEAAEPGRWNVKTAGQQLRSAVDPEYGKRIGEKRYGAEHMAELVGELKGLVAVLNAPRKASEPQEVIVKNMPKGGIGGHAKPGTTTNTGGL